MSFIARLSALAMALPAISAPAFAQEEDFYRGRQLKAIVSTAAGGDYDSWIRLITRHWVKQIPGDPTFVIQNMPGAGGIIAANSFYHTAPRDGSTIAMIGRNLPFQALMKAEGIRFDPLKFNWIGSPELTSRVCVAMDDAPVKTAEDLFQTELIVGGAGAGTAVTTTPKLLAALLGMKFRIVEGYGSASNVQLAMERGEVKGICQTVSSLRAFRPGWLESGKMRVLFNMERSPLAEFKAPSILNFAKTPEQRQILTIYSSSVELGRPVIAPPETPPGRVALLRRTFEATLLDTTFQEEASRLKLDVSLVRGEELKTLVEELMATPPEVLKQLDDLTRK
jgi:tripartite-type tricarboxylate transporter receptor subunit TctC